MSKYITIFIVISSLLGACKNENSELGDKFFKKGNYQQAVDAYTEYLRMEPRDVKSIYNRGRAYEELGQYDKALDDFNRVINEDPLNTSALLSITSDFYYRQKDYENTIYYAEKVLELDQSSPRAYTLKGKGHQKLGNIQEAMEAYNDAVSVNSEYADAYISRGSLNIFLKKYNRACSDFKMAKSLGAMRSDDLIKKYCKN